MTRLHVVILEPVHSINEILRWHWAKRRKVQDTYRMAIHAAMDGVRVPRFKPTKCKVEVASYRKRLLDFDNLVGGTKLIVDALRKLGIVYRDSPKWLDLGVRQEIDGKHPRTEIFISMDGEENDGT